MADAIAAMSVRNAKNCAWLVLLHSMPTAPADRLPMKIARNQASTVVAPNPIGAKPANSPNPVGKM